MLEKFEPTKVSSVGKVMPLEVALSKYIKPGMSLHFAYSQGRPMAASNALVRVFKGKDPKFTFISSGIVANQTALVTEQIVSKLIVSFVGENYPTPGPNPLLQNAIDTGLVEIESNSLLVLTQRLAAGAYGFPFALTRSLNNSTMENNPSYRQISDPFGSGDPVGVVEALVPDITILHGLAADESGNILISPPFGDADVSAFSSRIGIIATVERIITTKELQLYSSLVKIPSYRVLSLSVTPFGCHPYAIYNPTDLDIPDYVEDSSTFRKIRKSVQDKNSFKNWTNDWIINVSNHEGYLKKLGTEKLEVLRSRAEGDAWLDDISKSDFERISKVKGYEAKEMMVIMAARVLSKKVQKEGHLVVQAGVGFANLAAWIAVYNLQHKFGIQAELVAEIGIYGYTPKAGEPFIFSNRNLTSVKSMSGVENILGLQVGGRHNVCVAIIGSGQIDPTGNINSTLTSNGGYLLGSGGANDIASTAAEVIVVSQQSQKRLIPELNYITSPGTNVSTLVTDLGVFEKQDGRLILTQYFENPDESTDNAIENIRSRCGWELEVSENVSAAQPPSQNDLLLLRLFDSRNDFFKHSQQLAEVTL